MERLLLNAGFPDAHYLWQDGTVNSVYNASSSGT